jgi:hypothetical protein
MTHNPYESPAVDAETRPRTPDPDALDVGNLAIGILTAGIAVGIFVASILVSLWNRMAP